MRSNFLATLTTVAIVLGAGALANAGAKQIRYIGIHPIAKSAGSGMCYIEGPHVHVYEADKLQYRDHHGAHYFVGDPVAYGYDGPKHAYKGNHPIHVHAVVHTPEPDIEYCYLDGPHFHYFTPPEGPDFKLVGDTYFYIAATPPQVYLDARPAFVGINAVYTPLVYTRPVVSVAPPVGWIGAHVAIVAPAAVVVAPTAVVTTPSVGVHVHVPAPSVRIGVGIGVGVGVGIGGGVVHERVKVKRGRAVGKRRHR